MGAFSQYRIVFVNPRHCVDELWFFDAPYPLTYAMLWYWDLRFQLRSHNRIHNKLNSFQCKRVIEWKGRYWGTITTKWKYPNKRDDKFVFFLRKEK